MGCTRSRATEDAARRVEAPVDAAEVLGELCARLELATAREHVADGEEVDRGGDVVDAEDVPAGVDAPRERGERAGAAARAAGAR